MWQKSVRVCVSQDVNLQPHTTLKAGEEGVITRTYEDPQGVYAVDVRMDKFHKGLAEWDNEAHLTFPEIEALEIVGASSALNTSRSVNVTTGGGTWAA